MVPRIAKRGCSFKGAGAYYLHDKGTQTAERVAWSHTLNLPTDDPERAMRLMAWTDMHAADLKRASGVSMAGREQTAGNVYAYSLSWHEEQRPDKAAMLAAAAVTLERLGLSQHQAVIVAHGDTAHPHAHIIVNLVHPETGRAANVRQDRRKLSAWASEYERDAGAVYCRQREENAERRAQGRLTKHQDERLPDAPSLTEIYRQCDTGKAFAAALAEAGYTLAHGDKGRLVIVDAGGGIQNIVRQIEGATRKDIEAKLSDIELAALPSAAEEAARRKAEPRREEERAAEPAPPQQEEERRPTPPPLVSEVAAVSVRRPEPPTETEGERRRDPHAERVQAHMRRDEEAGQRERAEAAQETRQPRRHGLLSHIPDLQEPRAALMRHIERIAAHMQRFAQRMRGEYATHDDNRRKRECFRLEYSRAAEREKEQERQQEQKKQRTRSRSR
jgi:hypothetical protein